MRSHITQSWTRTTAAAIVAIAAVTGTAACSSSPPASSATSSATSPTAASPSQHMNASGFATAVAQPGTIVLDVRTPAEFATGHLPKALNIDLEGPDFAARIGALDKKATYAVYCHSGNRSNTALQQMAAADFTHAFDLTGGIGAWQSMGGPMSMGTP